MIQPFILRRSKRDVEKQMPKKYEHILKCRLSKRQKSMYEDILIQPRSAQKHVQPNTNLTSFFPFHLFWVILCFSTAF